MKKIILLIAVLTAAIVSNAATYYWIGFGDNWSNDQAWSTTSGGGPCTCVPTATDDVVFDGNGADCTIDIGVSVNSINMTAAYASSITFGGLTSFTNTTTFTCTGGTFDATGADLQTLGDVIINGASANLKLANASGVHSITSLSVSNGTFDGGSTGQILITGTASPLVTLTGGTLISTSGELTLDYQGGNTSPTLFNYTAGTFTHNSGLVFCSLNKNGTNTVNPGSITFYSLTIDNATSATTRTITFGSGTINIAGTLKINSTGGRGVIFAGGGTFSISGDLDLATHLGTNVGVSHTATFKLVGAGTQNIIGNSSSNSSGLIPNVLLQSSGTVAMTGYINVAGTWSYSSGTAGANSSTVTVYGTRTIFNSGSIPFSNLNIKGIITLNGAIEVDGALVILSGNTLNTSASNYGITLQGDFTRTGTLTINNSTITLSGGNPQSINVGATTLYALTLSKSSNTATLTNTLSCSNTLNIGATSTLNTAGYAVTLSGDLITSGTLTPGSSTFTLSGGSAQAINFNGTTINALSLTKTGSSTATLGGALSLTGALTIGATSVLNTGGFALTLQGNLATSGTLTAGSSDFTVSGSTAQSLNFNSATINSLTVNKSSNTATLASALNINGALTITSGTLNTSGSNYAISLGGNLSNTGTFTVNNSTITCTGASAQSFDVGITPITINTLVVNKTNTVTVLDHFNISTLLTVTSGTFAANGFVTLLSTASGTANVGTVGGTITGDFNVQRYIPNSGRRWRFLAAPIKSSSNLTIRNGWQQNMFISGGTGGVGPVGAANYNNNGFDWTLANSASMLTFSEATNAWSSPASTTTSYLTAGTGYRVFVRGDRSATGVLDGSVGTQSAVVTLNATGNIPTGDFPVTITNGGTGSGWNLIGNPYPCVYNFNAQFDAAVGYSNILNTVYVWDATANSYISYNAFSNTGTLASGLIPSGSSFWVQTTGASPSFTFKEAYKSTSAPYGTFKTDAADELKIKMVLDNSNFDQYIFKYVSGASKNADSYDIQKMNNPTINLSSYGTDNVNLSLSAFPTINSTDTLYLNANAPNGTYTFYFNGVNSFSGAINMYLIDNYTSSIIDLRSNAQYVFTINNAIPASFGTGRFSIIFSNNPSSLPVTLSEFKAAKNTNMTVNLIWSTVMELNNDHFEVERSIDKINYSKIGQVKGNGNSTIFNNYKLIDVNPNVKVVNYYRLKQVDRNGNSHFSPVVPVDFENNRVVVTSHESLLNVYPIPAAANINVTLKNVFKGDVKVNVYDVFGKLVSSHDATVLDNEEGVSEDVSNLRAGVYFIEISAISGEFSDKTKFVKE